MNQGELVTGRIQATRPCPACGRLVAFVVTPRGFTVPIDVVAGKRRAHIESCPGFHAQGRTEEHRS